MTIAVLLSLVVAAVNPEGLQLVGDARLVNGVLRLTPAKNDQHGAAWRDRKVHVRAGFDTSFRFQFTEQGGLGNGADGIAFVIQNNGPRELAAHGGAGGFSSDAQGGRRGGRQAITNSLAVFFDTFRNEEAKDPSDNMVIINTNATKTKWPPPRLAINSRLPVNLKDGRIHQARIVYRPPLLTVYLDENEVIRTPVDLGRMTGADGMGYVGFTAATGGGFENHDVLDWVFTTSDSDMYQVSSEISFARFECMSGRNLCTPADAIVEPRGANEFFIVLPAHREWSAAIPNPQGRRVVIVDPRGQACWDLAKGGCGGPSEDILMQKHSGGRTLFSLRDISFADNEGYFEFTARIVDAP